ncbi:hypothetical protein FGG08_007079 [Glutinoglossum americanum]|uniref:RING-type domain-containing protein n=1 Tax=Glutinoglossum americanum TaxID=1670608 RepID=A0A9P8L0E2_9PEZI|nr:hypothetical protein FGG08_007079 [Glutinoglossum americanum]
MSAEESDDATQRGYFSGSEAGSQPDSVLDIGTQFEPYYPHEEPELEVDLSSQIREHHNQGIRGFPKSSKITLGLSASSKNPKGGDSSHGGQSSSKSAQQPQTLAGTTIRDPSLLTSGFGVASLEGKNIHAVFDADVLFDKRDLLGTGTDLGCKKNPIKIDSGQPRPIELPDDDVIFVSCRPRQFPLTPLSQPMRSSPGVRVKEEPGSQEDTWNRLSAIAAKVEATNSSLSSSLGPARDVLSGPSSHLSVREPDSDIATLGRTPDINLPPLGFSKESVRPRYVPKEDVVEKIQANLLKKYMRKSTLSSHEGFGGGKAGPIEKRESRTSRIGAGNPHYDSYPPSAGVREKFLEASVTGDDPENAWMNDDISDEEEDSDSATSYERLKTAMAKEKSNATRLKLEVELIAAGNRKDVRNRRRRMGSQSREYVVSTVSFPAGDSPNRSHSEEADLELESQGGLFIPDSRENVHKQRKRAHEAFQRYKTPYEVSPGEIEEFDIDQTDIIAKKPRVESGSESQLAMRATTEIGEGQEEVGVAAQRSANTNLEQVPPNEGRLAGSEDDVEVALLNAIVQSRSAKKPRKKAGPRRKTAKEVHLQKTKTAKVVKASKADKANKSSKTTQGAKGGKVTKSTAKAPKVPKKGSKKKTTNVANGLGDTGEDLLHSLFFTDAIAQRQAQGDFGEAPVIGEKLHKDRMLKELMASVPKEHKRLVTNDKMQVLKASKNFGYGAVKAFEGKWLLRGMKVGRELGSREKGGILADAMGLGKTLQMLATMVGNPPDPGAAARATLLIVPSSVIEQWQDEIRTHVEEDFFKRVLHFKKSKEIPLSILQTCDVIITSYTEILASYPYPSYGKEREMGALETGINDVDPWVSLFKNFYHFKKEFCDPDSEDCNARLLTMLSMLMIRRTLKDKMFNRPIVELPETYTSVRRVDFSKEERCLYEIIEERFRMDFNLFLREGTAKRNYRTMVVKLLRLRQLTAHPFLLQQTIQDIFTLEDVRKLEARLNQAQQADGRPLYEKVGRWVKERVLERQADGIDANEPQTEEESRARSFGKSDFGTSFSIYKYLNTLDEKEMLTRCVCRICHDVAFDPQITDCYHVFCKPCIEEEASRWAQEGHEFTECPACNNIFLTLVPWFDLTAKENTASPSSPRAHEDEENDRAEKNASSWLNIEGELLPSAKTIALKAVILDWIVTAPNDKIVVFTQFRLM